MMRWCPIAVALLGAAPAVAAGGLSAAEQAGAFKAAGFVRKAGAWRSCDDPGTASYSPGSLEEVGDLNGDGQPEAVITEESAYCYGNTGQGFSLVSRQTDGSWKLIAQETGVPRFLTAKGAGGWPDMEVGGPGFCFPVERWNGKAYVLNRHEYEDKPCRP